MATAQHPLEGVIVRAGLGWTLGATVLAMVVSSFVFASVLGYARAGDMRGAMISVGAGGLISALLTWFAAELWVGQSEFRENELVRKSLFGSKRIPLSQVVAFRRKRHRYGQYLTLLNAEGRALLLLDAMIMDCAVIEEWAIANLEDADNPKTRREE